MRLKIKTQHGQYHFWYAKRLWSFNSLENAMRAAYQLIWHQLEVRMNVYAENGITLYA